MIYYSSAITPMFFLWGGGRPLILDSPKSSAQNTEVIIFLRKDGAMNEKYCRIAGSLYGNYRVGHTPPHKFGPPS